MVRWVGEVRMNESAYRRMVEVLSTNLADIKRAAHARGCLDVCAGRGEECAGRGEARCTEGIDKAMSAYALLTCALRLAMGSVQYCECPSVDGRPWAPSVAVDMRGGKLVASFVCNRCGRRYPAKAGTALLNRAVREAGEGR